MPSDFDVIDFLTTNRLITAPGDVVTAPLATGFWNRVIRVTGANIDWVIKYGASADEQSLYPNLPQSEYHALQFLDGHDIAPRPIVYVERRDITVLVYEYIDGTHWQSDVVAVAQLLHRLHSLPVDDDRSQFRRLPTTPAIIRNQADELVDQLSVSALADRIRTIRPPDGRLMVATQPVLIHTDVGAGNLIQTDDGLRLIDWQCPGIGDPLEDVACVLSPASNMLFDHPPLTECQQQQFVAAYDDTTVTNRLTELMPYLSYRIVAYCFVRMCAVAPTAPDIAARYWRAGVAEAKTLCPAFSAAEWEPMV